MIRRESRITAAREDQPFLATSAHPTLDSKPMRSLILSTLVTLAAYCLTASLSLQHGDP